MKVLALFRALHSNDLHWLSKFVQSPAHNRHREVVLLFQYFREHAPRGRDEYFTTERLSAALFGEGTLQQAKTHHATNYLLKCIEAYLAWAEWEANEAQQRSDLYNALQQRGLTAQSGECLRAARAQHAQQPLRNAAYLRRQYRLDFERYEAEMQHGRPEHANLQALNDSHDLAFIAEKLKNACILISRQRVIRMNFDMGLLDAVLAQVTARPDLLESPAVSVYYHGYCALANPDDEGAFQALRSDMQRWGQCFPVSELRDVYLLAINFCIHHINRREEQYLREVFEIYKAGLAAEVFTINGTMTRFTYSNIVSTALRLREFDWALEFIEKQRDLLPAEQRTGTYAFNLARYYCDRGDYDRAMPLLQQMDFDDPLLNLQGKMMLLKMYYESEEIDALKSLLASMDIYLRRKKHLSAQTHAAHRNTLRFVRRLLALPPSDAAAKANLKAEIGATAEVAMKEWLLGV